MLFKDAFQGADRFPELAGNSSQSFDVLQQIEEQMWGDVFGMLCTKRPPIGAARTLTVTIQNFSDKVFVIAGQAAVGSVQELDCSLSFPTARTISKSDYQLS